MDSDSEDYKRAMQQLQALLKAILLRRTKTSKIDGKSILALPPRTVEITHAVFNEDEQKFYDGLETKTQIQFNRYMEAGSVGRNYSSILVLLLRLRQACCHPHLIKDFAVKVNTTEQGIDMIANAKLFGSVVVQRLKENETEECPICMDAVENAIVFYPCGHGTCSECFARISDPSAGLANGIENSVEVKCPNCRTKVETKKITDTASFRKVHVTGETEEPGPVEKADESDDDDSESDNMADFVVDDDEDPYATRERKKKSKGKGKGKASDKLRRTLAALKKESTKNAKAKQKYLRRLAKAWIPSAKTEKTMEVLSQIQAEGEKTIVFSQFTSLLDLLEVPIAEQGWGYKRYDGSMKPVERNQAVLDFSEENSNCQILLVSLKAGNSGLNLVAASRVIIFDPFWNPYIEEQAIDRAHRLGQMRPVIVHRILVENTVEDRIIQLQEKKRKLIEGALDEKASSQISRLGTRELAFLFVSTSYPENFACARLILLHNRVSPIGSLESQFDCTRDAFHPDRQNVNLTGESQLVAPRTLIIIPVAFLSVPNHDIFRSWVLFLTPCIDILFLLCRLIVFNSFPYILFCFALPLFHMERGYMDARSNCFCRAGTPLVHFVHLGAISYFWGQRVRLGNIVWHGCFCVGG